MITINNVKFNSNTIKSDDLFICAFGYESRSLYLFEKVQEIIQNENILIFYFDDYRDIKYIEQLSLRGIHCIKASYNLGNIVRQEMCHFVFSKNYKNIRVHIDYSSMPRNWYYNLPILLKRENLIPYFWYVVGEYPMDYTGYPTAGIDSFCIIGRPSLRTDGKRLHIFGLSYDAVRTKALISEIDPESYITCNAFDSKNKERGKYVNTLNQQVRDNALNELVFNYDSFSFMFSRLCEIAIEYSNIGNVIFVPDGPKPLIFAMSLVALGLEKEGVSCLHVYRNEHCFSVVNVKPTDYIVGFTVD